MFTGIIEALGKVTKISKDNTNLHFTITAPFTQELKVDQSVAHNGCCLTVVDIQEDQYTVTAVKETLEITNLGSLQAGDWVNLERCMILNSRLDGHIVQGHVDQVGELISIKDENGSHLLTFRYDEKLFTTVNKGSVTVNGISLTVVNSKRGEFSVAVIPYTWEHTNLHTLKIGDHINLEFDIIGKYVAKLMQP
ncbi:riboflavin synthase [Elizabethkingia sp. JS20170427COW]|uniref:riboflavin synthase n=1 Tax=Elizabethkingia sp. JS20170427COW TaxID=2583851 RepID=UPI001110D4F4|nr:riboflavin synthase [Elizabethkingia sp. JS20170427COW]QCX53324.1 riboflavin synthase [Elizabethkingia sp. JS20170427COW]